jgi:ligand-binding sensor domain-containing protein
VWITTLDGVFRLDGTTFVPFPLPVAAAGAFEFTPKMVYCISEDRDGDLWFGTDGAGAVRWDGTDTHVYTAREHGLCSDRVSAILQDRRGDVWFGTSDGGVSRWDGTTFTTHLRSPSFSRHTGWGRYLALFEDRTGAVWFGVASEGGGAWRWDGAAFRHFSEQDGLGTGAIPSIDEDRAGNLWFGTTAGVYRYDGERFVHFTKDG